MPKSLSRAIKKDLQASTPSTSVAPSASPTSVGEGESRGESANAAADSSMRKADDQSPAVPDIESALREDLIRQAAYRRFKERGTPHGDEVQDWLEAEAEINQSLVE